MQLPVTLTGKIMQCCVHGDKIFIGTNDRNTSRLAVYDIFIWSLKDGTCRLFFQTSRMILDFVTCDDKLIVSLNDRDFTDDDDPSTTNDILFFTMDGKFHHGFDIFSRDTRNCAIDDVQRVIYAFAERSETKTFSFKGKHIRNETFDEQEYFSKNRDRNGNANLRLNWFGNCWVIRAISDSKVENHNNNNNSTGNYKVHYSFSSSSANSMYCGHVSKFNTLFLNDSTQIFILDERCKLVAQGKDQPGLWKPFERVWNFLSSYSFFPPKCSSWFGFSSVPEQLITETSVTTVETIKIKATDEIDEIDDTNETRGQSSQSNRSNATNRRTHQSNRSEITNPSDSADYARIQCSTLDAYGKLYIFSSTHCHVYV